MLFFSFLNAHKKVEFRGALFGGFGSSNIINPLLTAGIEIGAKIKPKKRFFIIPTLAVEYNWMGRLLDDNKSSSSIPMQIRCKLGGGNERHSGYGIIGVGPNAFLQQKKFGPSCTIGGGYEYHKGHFGFFTELTALWKIYPGGDDLSEVLSIILPNTRITVGASFFI